VEEPQTLQSVPIAAEAIQNLLNECSSIMHAAPHNPHSFIATANSRYTQDSLSFTISTKEGATRLNQRDTYEDDTLH